MPGNGGSVSPTTERQVTALDVRYAGLEQKVYGLDQSILGIKSAVDSLAAKFEERSRTPWGVLASIAGVSLTLIMAVGALAYAPILSNVQRIEVAVDRNHAQVLAAIVKQDEQKVDRDQYLSDQARGREYRDDVKKQLEKMVPADFHKIQWEADQREKANTQRQIDELKNVVNNFVTVSDTIKNLQSGQKEADQRFYAMQQQLQQLMSLISKGTSIPGSPGQ